MLRKIYFSIVAFILFGAVAFAQNNNGSIKVLLQDNANGEAIPFANVVAYQNGVQVGVATTDIDGYAVIKPLAPGKYDVKGIYVGYQAAEVKGIIVKEGATAYQTIKLSNGSGVNLDEVVVVEYQVPLIDPDTKSGGTVTREEYQNMATKNINSVAATTAGVFQADEGKDINVRGGRSDNTTYFVDGVKVIGGNNIPQQSVEQIAVITGGLPAQYGDATSGVISVTTRGPQSQFFGGVELISSQLTDAYGYNSLGFSVGGPILQKKDSAGHKTPVIGFFLSGQGTYQKDPSPSYVPLYRAKDDLLKEIEDEPLRLSPTGANFIRKLDYVTKQDMVSSKARQNVASKAIQVTGKLDFKLAPNTNLTVGGSLDYQNYHDFIFDYSMFNSQNNPQVIKSTWRTFARISQKFGNNLTGTAKEKSQSLVSNSYFTFLASYEQYRDKTQDDSHKDNLFNYGYIGKFYQNYDTGYSNYSLKVINNGQDINYYYNGPTLTGVTFDRSDINATAANYTSQIFNYYGSLQSLNAVQINNGFINGDRPQGINSLFSSTGRQYNGNLKNERSQLRFSASFSSDIKNHAIMVGVEYDQRNERGYQISPIDLWTRMRQLAYLSKNTDTTYIGQYNNYDAYMIRYDNANSSSQFIRSMVEELGAPGKSATYINVDQYDPSQFKLSMFSADDLLNGGVSSLVDYYGYDYLGNRYNQATNLDDFLNKKDAHGNNLYPVGSFRPIYVAGYIQDKFDFKDMKFNVGLRVDRFDANQKVPKDQYVFYDTYKAGDLSNGTPDNIGKDYVVYIKENLASNGNATNPTVTGYRDGTTNKWYNAEGKEVSDPTALNSGATSYPYLKDPSQAAKPFSASAFTDYKAQINFMPRVAFSFPISDVANFFAHYDVLTQRPSLGNAMRFDPKDYYFLAAQSSGAFITNPNLKPEKTVDYELGYNQVLNEKKNAALKITAFYREMRNQITVVSLNMAYPKTYLTYANQDFGTVKGLSMEFDLRRTNGVRLTANYTLQFADGSGSNRNSGANLATSGQPNLRVTLPLDYDQRHNITVNLDYRFGAGKDYRGPKWDKKKKDGSEQTIQLLKDVGANFIVHLGSGSPYTRWSNAVPIGGRSNILGSLNGSNKPWQFRTDLRLDKNIELSWGKKEGDSRKTANLNIYLQVLNLLNTKNILTVYNFTGNPDDDGYLNSPVGAQNVHNALSPTAFTDQYNIYINNPNNYSRPRTIRIGVMLDF
ncbi:MAG: TonB-dependent receptor plug domain-containing protein [Bacteroidetes bacterium]|nr:TonB-dependent receptor plug domain-containing protein [Bacteroidota bacterium]